MLRGKLPSELVSERHQYVNSLKQFVEEQKQKLNEVLEKLGLTGESLAELEPKQVCPYNKNHFIPEKSFKKHVEKCRLQTAGYQKDELPSQLVDTDFCYEGKKSLKIEIDESLLNKIIWDCCAQSGEVYTGHRTMPVSHIDENVHLTQSDRLAIYQYVVAKSHEAGKVISVDKSDELLTTDWGSLVKKGLLDAQGDQKYTSKLDQLAALRDLKRRRQSYRAKNVHITKKSYTEIIREVILNQMEVLTPAKSKTHPRECDEEDRKTESKERKRKYREDKDRNSHRQRKRSRTRSGSRDKRRRKDEKIEQCVEHRSEISESQRQESKLSDVHCVKKEPELIESTYSKNSRDNSLCRNESPTGEVNDGKSSASPSRLKRSRSRSYSSSSHCSNEDERHHHHHHHHHKKSKHKRKSKHSKKHSKKHKK